MDNYVQTLLKTQTAENRADIVACLKQLDGIDSIKPSKDFLTVTLSSGKNIDSKAISTMKNSKLDLIQSISEQQQRTEQLQTNLQQLSQTLINFEQLIAQSEKPITEGTTLLHNVQQTTTALESHLRSILIAIKNLSPQAIQTLTTSYTEQIQVLQAQLCNIDISSIETVTTSIDSFSTSIQTLQEEINSQLGNITIDQESLQQSIQDQIQHAIANQSEQFQNDIQTLITEKLSEQRSKYIFWGMIGFGLLILSIVLYLGYQTNTNLKTIEAQREVIQQNTQQISNQIKILNQLRR